MQDEKKSKQKVLGELIKSMNQMMGEDIKKSKEPKMVEIEVSSMEPQEEPKEEEAKDQEPSEDKEPQEDEVDIDSLSDEEKDQIIKDYLKSKKD